MKHEVTMQWLYDHALCRTLSITCSCGWGDALPEEELAIDGIAATEALARLDIMEHKLDVVLNHLAIEFETRMLPMVSVR